MKLRLRYILAALGLAAATACMKAGDGVGLDTYGKIVPPPPFCESHPDDPSCSADPCVANPSSAACSLSLCQKDPARPGCTAPPDCSKDPSAPGCAIDSCKADPSLPGCQPKTKFGAVFHLLQANSCLTCHVPGGLGVTQGKLNMASEDSAYINLVGVPATFQTMAPGWKRVVEGKPDSSLFVHKLAATSSSVKLPDGKAYGGRMPLNLGPIPAADLDVIRKWIQDGAQR